jgi:hypothetical protein
MNILLESHLSDDEIVERTRKRLNANWKFRVLLFIASLGFGGILLWGSPMMVKWVTDGLTQSGTQWRWFYMGMSTGMALGTMLFLGGLMAILFLLMALFPNPFERRDRLLVKYYDKLHGKRS